MEYVLIHIHEGTMVSSWKFETDTEREAFEAKHRSTWGEDNTTYVLRYLPDGTLDDPDSDTWVLVEGALIEYVNGDEPVVVK